MNSPMAGPRIHLQDLTLRDGMHAVRHRYTLEQVTTIAAALDAAGVDAIEIAHGDGLAGSSVTYDPASRTDAEWIGAVASAVENARLTTLPLPSIGTIAALERAHDLGVTSVRVATRATEVDIAAQHIAKARDLGMDVSGFLMMSHLAPPDAPATQAKLMESYGARCVYVIDSGGRPTMDGVRDRVRAYRDLLDDGTEIGIHAHQEPLAGGCQQRGRGGAGCDQGGRLVGRDGRRCRQLPDRAAGRGGGVVGDQEDMIVDVALGLITARVAN